MQSFSDFLPKETKEKLVESQLKVGSVLKFKVTFKNGVTKPKIQIIVGINNGKTLLATVFVNTDINPNVFPTPKLKDLHIKLEPGGRDYLEHESFVDCSDIAEHDISITKDLLLIDPKIHVGELSDDDLKIVIEKILGATTISKKRKREFGFLP